MEFLWISLVIITSLTGLIGSAGVLLGYRHIYSSTWKLISFYSILYFATSFFNWLNLLFNISFPDYLIITNTIWCFTVFLNPVFLFRMVDSYTKVISNNLHLLFSSIIPTIGIIGIFLILFIRLASSPESENSSLLDSTSIVFLISIIGTGYTFLNLYMLRKYKKSLSRSESNPIHDRKLFPILSAINFVLVIMSPAWFMILPVKTIFLILTTLLILTFSMLHILLAVRLIIDGKELHKIRPALLTAELKKSITNESLTATDKYGSYTIKSSEVTLPLNKRCFNDWMKKNKPYLNPELKIEKLALLYGVPVRELSGFLNREYRMNFNRYINQCRLVELRYLKAKHTQARLTELVSLAGFGSMVSYNRAKASNEKRKES